MPLSFRDGSQECYHIDAHLNDIDLWIEPPTKMLIQHKMFIWRRDTGKAQVRVDDRWLVKPGGFLLLHVVAKGDNIQYERTALRGGLIELVSG